MTSGRQPSGPLPYLPTPDTDHVDFDRVYEPAEDSFFFLDTLASDAERAFLWRRFAAPADPAGPADPTGGPAAATPTPLLLEIGPGSGVLLAFLTAHARLLLGRPDVLSAAVDVNRLACAATGRTVTAAAAAAADSADSAALFLGAANGSLGTPVRAGTVDVLLFNPPYVPTESVPALPAAPEHCGGGGAGPAGGASVDDPPAGTLLELACAGGAGGMEVTARLLADLPRLLDPGRGCAYVLLSVRNGPAAVRAGLAVALPPGWAAEIVAESGGKGGWERLCILRVAAGAAA